MSLTYEIGGRGKDGGTEGRMIIFSITFKLDGQPITNPQKEDIVVHVECPGTPPRCTVMITNGVHHIGFTPAVGGKYWFDLTYKGTWLNEPFCLPVKNKANLVPDHPYTGAARGGVPAATTKENNPSTVNAKPEPTKILAARIIVEPCPTNSSCSERIAALTDDEEGSFKITSVSNAGDILKGDFKFDIQFEGPSDVSYKLSNNGDGTYSVVYGPISAGEYRVEVSYKGKLIEKGSWKIQVVEALALMSLEELMIMVQATDKNGNPKSSGGEAYKFKVIISSPGPVDIEDQDDGKYIITYSVKPGLNSIDVQYDGDSISGFPLSIEIPTFG
jgi:hypothetical protein